MNWIKFWVIFKPTMRLLPNVCQCYVCAQENGGEKSQTHWFSSQQARASAIEPKKNAKYTKINWNLVANKLWKRYIADSTSSSSSCLFYIFHILTKILDLIFVFCARSAHCWVLSKWPCAIRKRAENEK